MRISALFATLIACCVGPATSFAVTIDPLTTAFPPNPNLPVTQPVILFVGNYCDGAACPPSATVSQTYDEELQTGVPGVPGGIRLVQLQLQQGTLIVAQDDPIAQRVNFTPGFDGEGLLWLRYGQVGGNNDAGKLHANLAADGSTAFLLEIESTAPSNLRFVSFGVGVTSHWGEPNQLTDTWFESVTGPGIVRFDFSSFPGIDFTQVDALTIMIWSQLQVGIPVSIGPIVTDGGVTPVRTGSWGRLKTIYR